MNVIPSTFSPLQPEVCTLIFQCPPEVYTEFHKGVFCCCRSVAKSCPIFQAPWTAAHQASLSFTISQSVHRLMSTESVMPSNHLILCHPLLLLPSIFPSIRVFLNESALWVRWLKYWSFSFSIIPSNEESELISFRMDWFDLLSIQGNLKSLLQYYSSKTSIIQHSAFFMAQLSHPHMTTGKTISLMNIDPKFLMKILGKLIQ